LVTASGLPIRKGGRDREFVHTGESTRSTLVVSARSIDPARVAKLEGAQNGSRA
jgi:hypothetical protein